MIEPEEHSQWRKILIPTTQQLQVVPCYWTSGIMRRIWSHFTLHIVSSGDAILEKMKHKQCRELSLSSSQPQHNDCWEPIRLLAWLAGPTFVPGSDWLLAWLCVLGGVRWDCCAVRLLLTPTVVNSSMISHRLAGPGLGSVRPPPSLSQHKRFLPKIFHI